MTQQNQNSLSDSQTMEIPEQKSASPTTMIKALGLVSTICGIIIVSAYQMTLSSVEENKRIATERSIYKVIPNAKKIEEFLVETSPNKQSQDKTIISKTQFDLQNQNQNQNKNQNQQNQNQQNSTSFDEKFFAAYDENNKFLGVAMEGSARGYGDVVRLMFAFEPSCECFTAMSVVAMRETPGIGDKITKDKAFLENFKALSAKLNEQKNALQNEIRTVKNGQKQNAWEIDAIAGATITSRAVGVAVNEAAKNILPTLMQSQNLEKLQKLQKLQTSNDNEKQNKE